MPVFKGNIYFHPEFQFSDGAIGEKLLIAVNEPSDGDPLLLLKTTSNLRNRQYQYGCYSAQRVFFIPSGQSSFPSDTLVQFTEMFSFISSDFLVENLHKSKIAFKDVLPSQVLSDLVACVLSRLDDISQDNLRLITK